MSSASPIVRNVFRCFVPALYFAVAVVIIVTGYLGVDTSRRGAMNFAMCVVLGFALFFLGVSSTGADAEGMDLGDFEEDDAVPAVAKEGVAAGLNFMEHSSRFRHARPPRRAAIL